MRIIQLFLISLLVAASPFSSVAAEAGRATVRAILVIASSKPGPADPKLAPYEPTLKSKLRYLSYRFAGESSATVAAGATATISLPSGNSVEIEGEKTNGPGITVTAHRAGSTFQVSPGRPVVFLGGKSGEDDFAIIVIRN